MIDVIELNELPELKSWRLLWRHLHSQTRNANFFQSLDWLEAYWRHFGHDQLLRVLVVSGSQGPLGILPLTVRVENTKVGPLRVLTYPLHDWGTFYGPIGPNPTATLLAGLNYLRHKRRNWDLLDLRWIPRDGIDAGRTANTMRSLGLSAYEQPWTEASLIELSGTWDEYWASRDGHWRNNIRRAQKKLAERGNVEHIRYRPNGAACDDADPRWDLYEECERLAEVSWQGSSDTGTTLSHDSVRDYLRDAHEAAVRAGAAEINLLMVDGRAAAFAYNYHYQGHVYGLRRGYDAEVSRDGAGNVLLAAMVADSFARGDHTFDLGPGSLESKRYWRTSVEIGYRYTHFAMTEPRAQMLRLGRWAKDRLATGVA